MLSRKFLAMEAVCGLAAEGYWLALSVPPYLNSLALSSGSHAIFSAALFPFVSELRGQRMSDGQTRLFCYTYRVEMSRPVS